MDVKGARGRSRSAAGPGRFSAFDLRGAQAANQSPRRRERRNNERKRRGVLCQGTSVAASVGMSHEPNTDPTLDPLTPKPDLAGLAVHDADDLLTGHVFGLLCEAETGLIRFLDVELEGKGRHVLVPVGHARVEASALGPRIRLRAASVEDLERVPAYAADGAWPNPEVAHEVLTMHGRFFRGDKYYAHPAYDHRGLYAGDHPIVKEGDTAGESESATLESLNQSRDFRIADGEPDVRGWTLVESRGAAAAEVTDVLIDPAAMKVRYLVVKLANRHQTILPIGYVEVKAESKQVVVPGLTAEDLLILPAFEKLPLSREQEDGAREHIERALDARNPFLRVDFSQRQVIA
jgi:hypothetical protein